MGKLSGLEEATVKAVEAEDAGAKVDVFEEAGTAVVFLGDKALAILLHQEVEALSEQTPNLILIVKR